MFIVYVLQSLIAKKSYVGFTNNIERRLKEHNRGRNTYTRRFMPWAIVHTEEYDSLVGARNREKYLKSASGRRFLAKNIFKR